MPDDGTDVIDRIPRGELIKMAGGSPARRYRPQDVAQIRETLLGLSKYTDRVQNDEGAMGIAQQRADDYRRNIDSQIKKREAEILKLHGRSVTGEGDEAGAVKDMALALKNLKEISAMVGKGENDTDNPNYLDENQERALAEHAYASIVTIMARQKQLGMDVVPKDKPKPTAPARSLAGLPELNMGQGFKNAPEGLGSFAGGSPGGQPMLDSSPLVAPGRAPTPVRQRPTGVPMQAPQAAAPPMAQQPAAAPVQQPQARMPTRPGQQPGDTATDKATGQRFVWDGTQWQVG